MEATDVDQIGGGSALATKSMAKWLESTGDARMKVQAVAEQSVEHLLTAVKRNHVSDSVVQRAPAKSHASKGHVERATRSILCDVQERLRIEVGLASAATARLLRHPCWLLNRFRPHMRRGTTTHWPHTIDCPLGGALVVAKGAPRTFSAVWVGRAEASDPVSCGQLSWTRGMRESSQQR